jgi:hypothetical protein
MLLSEEIFHGATVIQYWHLECLKDSQSDRVRNLPYEPESVVRFEVFTAVTMKNGVFWDVTPCGSCKNRRFGGNKRHPDEGGAKFPETSVLTRATWRNIPEHSILRTVLVSGTRQRSLHITCIVTHFFNNIFISWRINYLLLIAASLKIPGKIHLSFCKSSYY